MRSIRIPMGAVLVSCTLAAGAAHADAVDELLQQYRSEGASSFSASAGESFWQHEVKNPQTGEMRRCALCHTTDLRAAGKHAVTGKVIKPMAPSVNPERLSDRSKIQKWLERNCKWTLGRPCSPQEKGDVLVMIRSK